MSNKGKCNRCEKIITTKHLIKNKKDGKKYCYHCIKKFRKTINLGFSSKEKPPKHVVEGQKSYHKPKQKIKKIVKVLVKKSLAPIIPGTVKKEKRNLGFMYLKKEEKEILYHKYTKELNYSSKKAHEKIDEVVKRLQDLVQKLRNQKKPENEINRVFKEEFAKLVEKEK